MRAVRTAGAVLLALGLALVPRPAAADPSDGGPLFVPAGGGVVSTPFPTEATSTYQVVVHGAYSYNGGANLADCGWWNPEGEGDAWYRAGFLRVDGATAACAQQPYTTTHAYTWVQQGTGAPFRFSIDDPGYGHLGGLTVEVVEVTAGYDVDGYCELLRNEDSDDALPRVYGIVVHARVTGGGAALPATVSASCEITGSGSWSARVDTQTAYVVTAAADVALLPPGTYTACLRIVWRAGGVTSVKGPVCRVT